MDTDYSDYVSITSFNNCPQNPYFRNNLCFWLLTGKRDKKRRFGGPWIAVVFNFNLPSINCLALRVLMCLKHSSRNTHERDSVIVIAIKYAETAEKIAVKTGHIKMINIIACAQMLPS